MRSTQGWEKALEGTTPGPWIHNGIFEGVVAGDDITPKIIAQARYPLIPEVMRSNMSLIALVPEAVAEVVRLRHELETLRRDMRRQPSNALASEVGNAITIILEGTNE